MSEKVYALLLGREGSVGFPGKNIYPVLGRPMMFYPLMAALNAKKVDEVFLSTDSSVMKKIAADAGAKIINRPPELCTKEALGEDAFVHGYKYIKDVVGIEIELMVLLFCNAPTLVAETLDRGVDVLRNNPSFDSAATTSVYNMWSPVRARKIGEDGLLEPFIPFDAYEKEMNISCDRDAQGDVVFADCSGYVVRPRCLEDLNCGILPQRWMGKKIYPLKQWGGVDVDFEWQVPGVECWLKAHGFSETKTPYDKNKGRYITARSQLSKVIRSPREKTDRIRMMRLDKNEHTVGFSRDVTGEILSKMTSDLIAAYPQLDILYQKLANWLRCGQENLLISSGSDGAIKSVFEAYVSQGDKVIVPEPSYAMFEVYCNIFSARRIVIDFEPGLNLNVSKLLAQIDDQTKLIIIANPNSPTGTVMEQKDLIRIVEHGLECDAIVLIDEAYYHFYNQTMAGYTDKFHNLVITRTFSKACGLASARIGYAIGHPSVIEVLQKVRPMYETNGLAISLAEYIIEHDSLINRYVDDVNEGKAFLTKELEILGLEVLPGYANFILVKGVKKPELLAEALKEKKILIKAGFGHPSMKNLFRITLGPLEQMKTFIKVLEPLVKVIG